MTIGMDRNNPFDIEPNHIKWIGETVKTSPVTFDSMHDGLRAGVKVFLAYQRHHWNTPTLAIMHYAPPESNPTAEYITHVCDWCGVKFDQQLDFHDSEFMLKWSKAVIRQEQGEDALKLISDNEILVAIQDAYGNRPAAPKARLLRMKMPLDPHKTAGVMLGTYIAQLINSALPYFWHIPISDSVGSSITGICILLAVHFFKQPVGPAGE